MVVMLIVWWHRHHPQERLPAGAAAGARHLKFSPEALGWLKARWRPSITIIAVLSGWPLATGHERRREPGPRSTGTAYPKLKNLERAAS